MSVIRGCGYGDSHDWEMPDELNPTYPFGFGGSMIRPIGGPTAYCCKECGMTFLHFYHDIIDIFEAIKDSGVLDKCPNANS